MVQNSFSTKVEAVTYKIFFVFDVGEGEGKRFISPLCAKAPGWIPDECHGGLDKMGGLERS